MTPRKKPTAKKPAKAKKVTRARKPRKATSPKPATAGDASVQTNVAGAAGPRTSSAVKQASVTERRILEQFAGTIRTACIRLELSADDLAEAAALSKDELDAFDPTSPTSPTLASLCRAAEALQLNATLNIPI